MNWRLKSDFASFSTLVAPFKMGNNGVFLPEMQQDKGVFLDHGWANHFTGFHVPQ